MVTDAEINGIGNSADVCTDVHLEIECNTLVANSLGQFQTEPRERNGV